MAIGYLKKKQKLPVNGELKEVYLAKVCYANYIDIDVLAEDVSKKCSASPYACKGVGRLHKQAHRHGRCGEAGYVG